MQPGGKVYMVLKCTFDYESFLTMRHINQIPLMRFIIKLTPHLPLLATKEFILASQYVQGLQRESNSNYEVKT